MQPKMSIFGAMAEAGNQMEEEEEEGEEEEEEEAASEVQELEWTSEHQQRSVDVLMSFIEHDFSEEATPPAVTVSMSLFVQTVAGNFDRVLLE